MSTNERLPFISVIIPTYNRRDFLHSAITSLLRQSYPKDRYEVIVIDDGSTDNTKALVEEYIGSTDCNMKYFRQENRGLSTARNLGVEKSKGEIVAYIDDDAIAAPDWLSSLADVYLNEEVVCVGGRMWPSFLSKPPWWLSKKMRGVLEYDLGEDRKLLKEINECPHGSNISFRKSIFNELGCFKVNLGRQKGTLLSGEETEFCGRILKDGRKIVYEPSAIVAHQIAGDRLTVEYFLKRQYWQGVTKAVYQGVMLREMLLDLIRIPYLFVRFILEREPAHFFRSVSSVGYILYSLRIGFCVKSKQH